MRNGTVRALLLATMMLPVAAMAALQHGPSGVGYLGIEFKDIPDGQAAQMHTHGAEVFMVDHDGPAGKAGLRPHDIIVALNGQMIDGAAALRRMIHEAGAGVQVAIQVVRLGKPVTLNARLASRDEVERAAMARLAAGDDFEPPPQPVAPATVGNGFIAPGVYDSPAPSASSAAASSKASLLKEMLHATPFTGVAMEAMEPQLAGFFGATAGCGLLVNTVLPNSPAEAAGLHAGDIVLRADAISLKTTSDWTRHLHSMKGRPLTLVILRDKHEQTITLVPAAKHKTQVVFPVTGTDEAAFRS